MPTALLTLVLALGLAACSAATTPPNSPPGATMEPEPVAFVDAFGAAVGCPPQFDEQCRGDGLLPEVEAGYSGVGLQYAPSTTAIPLFIVTERHSSLSTTEAPEVGTLVELPTSSTEKVPLVPRAWSFGAQRHAVNLVALRRAGRIPLRWSRVSYRSIYGAAQITRVASYEKADASPPTYAYSGTRQTHVGPRGGVYHYSASGRKVYEKKSGSSSSSRKR